MPYFPPRPIPMEEKAKESSSGRSPANPSSCSLQEDRSQYIRIKNRRKRYLDAHPEYFNSDLELADPLLYDRLVRRFQTAREREAEGRAKGWSGILHADLMRGEAKLYALAHPDPNSTMTYRRGPHGEILEERQDEVPLNKEEAYETWKETMEQRFIQGKDDDFDYSAVDDNEEYDDRAQEERDREEAWFDDEESYWDLEEGQQPTGDTGVYDY